MTTADNAEVLYAVDAHIATITLNAPQRMNTISRTMLDELTRALIRANEDREVRCVILTGSGRAFCAGLDLSPQRGTGGIGSAAASATLDLRNTPPTVLHAMDKPTICASTAARPATAWTPHWAATSASWPRRPSWPRPSSSAVWCPNRAAPGSCRA